MLMFIINWKMWSKCGANVEHNLYLCISCKKHYYENIIFNSKKSQKL